MARQTRVQIRERFQLIIGGIPARWKWEELKDFVKSISDRVRTEVAPHPCSASGQSHQVGSITVNGRDEAERLYGFLENCVLDSRRVLVHYFDVTNATEANIITCNCIALGLSHLSYRTALSVYMSDYVPFVQIAPLPVAERPFLPAELPHGNVGNSRGSYQCLAPVQIPCQIPYGYQQPRTGVMNRTKYSGTLVNTMNGLAKTETRGIHITQLNFSTSQRSLEELLQKAAQPVAVTMKKKSSGKPKGTAAAVFASFDEAKRVVELLDGLMYMGRRLRVKLDHVAIARTKPPNQVSGAPAALAPPNTPIVVNGSNSRKSSTSQDTDLSTQTKL